MIATGMLAAFAGRVRLYTELDRQLAAHTRFVGAAALTNAALAALLSRARPRLRIGGHGRLPRASRPS
ncbi:MAG TPA: hypothetical protein VHX52_03170 [Steroidobacteraceae bacterium]|nr:hypothetical protein [Steroidobacteraceae bacterium]